MKTLWVVSGGMEAVPAIRRAREMGLHVVVSDGDPRAPGFRWAHDSVVASTYDVEATLGAARKYHQGARPIDGAICAAADVPLTVAALVQEFGLAGITPETARLASHKLDMKQRLQEAGVPIPWFEEIHSAEHLVRIAASRGFPLVIKPCDSRGARGVLQLTSQVDLAWAFEYARGFSPSSRVMVEEYLAGPQISTESIFFEGHAATPGFSDRNYSALEKFIPFMVEDGGQQPSVLGRAERREVARVAEQAAGAIGITTGSAKGDIVLTDDGAKVIEVAARLSGGWFCTHQIPLATGVDLVGVAIRLALGETVSPEELISRHSRGVAIRYFFPPPGRVTLVSEGLHQLENPSWVELLRLFVKPGDLVRPVTDHTRRAGFVLTTGDTREQAVRRAERVVAGLQIETTPQ